MELIEKSLPHVLKNVFMHFSYFTVQTFSFDSRGSGRLITDLFLQPSTFLRIEKPFLSYRNRLVWDIIYRINTCFFISITLIIIHMLRFAQILGSKNQKIYFRATEFGSHKIMVGTQEKFFLVKIYI